MAVRCSGATPAMVAGDNNGAVGGRTRWTGPGQGGVADEPKHVVACCRLRALTDDVATMAVSSMRTYPRVTFLTEVRGEDEPPNRSGDPRSARSVRRASRPELEAPAVVYPVAEHSSPSGRPRNPGQRRDPRGGPETHRARLPPDGVRADARALASRLGDLRHPERGPVQGDRRVVMQVRIKGVPPGFLSPRRPDRSGVARGDHAGLRRRCLDAFGR